MWWFDRENNLLVHVHACKAGYAVPICEETVSPEQLFGYAPQICIAAGNIKAKHAGQLNFTINFTSIQPTTAC